MHDRGAGGVTRTLLIVGVFVGLIAPFGGSTALPGADGETAASGSDPPAETNPDLGSTEALGAEERARFEQLIQDGIGRFEAGDYDGAIQLFEQAGELDPGDIGPPYEIGFAYMEKEDYEKALEYFLPLLEHPDVYDRVYLMAAACLDYDDRPEESIHVLNAGLQRFPDSGPLYNSRGVVEFRRQEVLAAIDWWELGVMRDPTHPLTYYYLALAYSDTTEGIWTLMYGEIFRLLEPDSPRSEKLAVLLHETWVEAIEVRGGKQTGISVNYSKRANQMTTAMAERMEQTGIGSFEMHWEMCMAKGLVGTLDGRRKKLKVDTARVAGMRKGFVSCWFDEDGPPFENPLTEYWRALNDEGHMEAHTWWLLAPGDPKKAARWDRKNLAESTAYNSFKRMNPFALEPDTTAGRRSYLPEVDRPDLETGESGI